MVAYDLSGPPKNQKQARRQQGKRIRGQMQRATASALLAAGNTVAQIADKMAITEGTVQKYLADSMDKVVSMSEAERIWSERFKRPAPPASDRGKALEWRIQGWTYQNIADQLGYDEGTIRKWVRTEMERLHALEVDAMDSIRRLQLERIDQMLMGLWPKASNGDPKSVDTTLKLLERQAKLLGLDAPERIELETHMRQVAEEMGLTEDDAELAVKEVQAMMRARK